MSKVVLAQYLHLACDGFERPVAFARIEEIDAQARCDNLAVAMLRPVDGEGEELVALEIHHREKLVHQTRAKPPLGVLADGGVGVPSVRAEAGEVVELTDGRTTHLHPRFQSFHTFLDGRYDVGDVLPTLRARDLDFPRLGIADVVEVNAVDVVVSGDFLADVGKISGRLLHLGVHESVLSNLANHVRIAFPQLGATRRVPFAHRDGNHPRMKFHSASMAFVDGKLKGVIARTHTRLPTQAAVPRFVFRRIDGGGADARLQKHGVDAAFLQPVEYVAKLLFLSFNGLRGGGERVRPVDSTYCGEPHGPHFVLGSLCENRQPEGQNDVYYGQSFHNSYIFGTKVVIFFRFSNILFTFALDFRKTNKNDFIYYCPRGFSRRLSYLRQVHRESFRSR